MDENYANDMDEHMAAVVIAWRFHQANLILPAADPLRVASYANLLAAQDKFARLTLLDETNSDVVRNTKRR